jgi:pimeloyl-ACP methyl ester carboxylesterase
MWDGQLAALADRHLVVRYDQSGFGRSTPAAEPYSYVAELDAVLDRQLVVENVTGIATMGAMWRNGSPAYGRLHEVDAATLVVVGDRDQPDHLRTAKLLAAEITGARLAVLCRGRPRSGPAPPSTLEEIVMTTRMRMAVAGMSCDSCNRHVTGALRAAGAADVEADWRLTRPGRRRRSASGTSRSSAAAGWGRSRRGAAAVVLAGSG